MSKHFVQNAVLRAILLRGYRLYAQSHLWRSGHRIFLNSIPKAGTHLLISELEKTPELMNSRLHIQLKSVGNYDENNSFSADTKAFNDALYKVKNGQFFSAHMFWEKEVEDLLRQNNIKMIFLIRDPRDILVSKYHYIMALKRHDLHKFLSSDVSQDAERWRLLVEGNMKNPFIRPMSETLKNFLPWKSVNETLTVQFEKLIGEQGGGSYIEKQETLIKVYQHCGLPTEQAKANTNVKTWSGINPTFRKGKAFAWRESLPPSVIDLVHRNCENEILQLGYLDF